MVQPITSWFTGPNEPQETAFMASLLSNILKGKYLYCSLSNGTLVLRIP